MPRLTRRRCLATVVTLLTLASVAVGIEPASAAPGTVTAGGTRIGPVLETATQIPAMTPLPQGFTFRQFVPPRQRYPRGCGRKDHALFVAAVRAPAVRPGCRIVGGVWTSADAAHRIRSDRRIHVFPVVAMSEAWAQGAFDWTDSERRIFAMTTPWARTRSKAATSKLASRATRNCHLTEDGVALGCAYAVVSKARTRGAVSLQDLIVRHPERAVCSDVRAVISVLSAWGLAMDPEARPALLEKAAQCSRTSIKANDVRAAPAVRDVFTRNPFLPAGAAAMLPTVEAVLAASPGPPIDRTLFGLHIPPRAPEPTIPFGVRRLWDSDVGWNVLEPQRGRFNWEAMDAAVASARTAGHRLIYVLGPTPEWAGPRATDPPRDLGALRAFVAALAGRYGSDLYAIEVWNEPNLQTFFTGSARDLVDITKAVKQATSGTSVLTLSPSTTTRATPSLYRFYRQYLRSLRSAGWPVDGFTFHSYPRATGGPQERAAGMALFKGMLIALGAPTLPMLDTEVNYGLGGLSEARRSITGADAQGYLAQTFVDAIRLGVTNVSWYLWTAGDYPLLGIQLNPSSAETRAAWTWTFTTLVGASFTGCTEQGAALLCGFIRDGSRFLIASSMTGAPTPVTLPEAWSTSCTRDGGCAPTGGSVLLGIRPVVLRPAQDPTASTATPG